MKENKISKNRNQMVDIVRIIACFMVILCHVQFPGVLARYSMAIARFAVLYFMIVSGWYLWDENNDKALSIAKKTLLKTLLFTFKSLIFISIVNTIVCMINNKLPFEWFILFKNSKNILMFVILNRAYFFSSIVWYLLAMIYVLIIYIISLKAKILNKMYVLIIPLIILNLTIGLIFNMDWYYSGNWLLTGLPFVLLGSYLHSTNWWKKIDIKQSFLFIIIGILLTIFEAYFRDGKILYLGSIFVAFGIFTFAIKSDKNNFNKSILAFAVKCTPIIFVIHCSLKEIIYSIFSIPNNYLILIFMPFLIFVLSSIISIFVIYIKNIIKSNYIK